MHILPVLALAAPLAAALIVAATGWRPAGVAASIAAPAVILGCGLAMIGQVHPGLIRTGALRVDALAVVMLVVIGTVGLLATTASVGYLRREHVAGHLHPRAARRYGILVQLFLASMTLAVIADNLGVMWVAIEATTVVTAFLVGHHHTRAALEATWKYVILCSVGIALAFLGTVLLYFASVHSGSAHDALGFETLLHRAAHLDPGVTRLAAVLLLLGYGTKVGLAPFHTWLADAHSQAPAPVSALMSGVLLAVALTSLLRVKAVIDAALGVGFMRAGLLSLGLLTLVVAAGLLIAQRDFKRLLAYSSMEQMAFAAIAAAATNPLAVSAVLLLVIVHGLAKAVMFIVSGHLQQAHRSTAIPAIRGLLARSPALAAAAIIGLCALVGLPPFGIFPAELGAGRGLADAGLAWPLGIALLFVLVAVAALASRGGAMLFGDADAEAPPIRLDRLDLAVLGGGITGCLVFGLTAGPLNPVLMSAGHLLAGGS
ncbi:MAG TPA: proton-conducting transporter membrane subunit [Mycobacteriales bacterium]|nr:proton-conducting transporter membrane subunit [Mycobacteriales bacterium]